MAQDRSSKDKQMQRSEQGGGMSSTMRGTPFGFMRRMMDDMDRLFGDYGMSSVMPRDMEIWTPQIEVMERGGKLVVRADLPGMKKEDVRVHVEEGALVVEGERRREEQKNEGGVWHTERSYGSFRRMIPLPKGTNVDTCDARFDAGVLEVQMDMPKEENRRKPIAIRSGEEKAQEKGQGRPAQPQENGPGAAPSTRH